MPRQPPTPAERASRFVADYPAPLATGAVAVLVVIALAFAGFRPGVTAPNGRPLARIGKTQARLADGACEFAADVELDGRFSRYVFSSNYLSIRSALRDLMRTKRVYMVDSPTARQALRYQMVREVNRVVGRRVAADLRFTEFELLLKFARRWGRRRGFRGLSPRSLPPRRRGRVSCWSSANRESAADRRPGSVGGGGSALPGCR